MRCIELFGVPGSGKTTYANTNLSNYINLNKKYIYHTNRFLRNLKKMLCIIKICFFHPLLFFSFSVFFHKIHFNNFKLKLKIYVYFLNTLYISMISKKYTIDVLIEEGIIQVLWAICYNADVDGDFLQKFYDKVSKYISRNVIYLDVDESILCDRLLNRNLNGGSELEHDIKKDTSYLVKAKTIEKNIVTMLEKNKLNIEKGEVL